MANNLIAPNEAARLFKDHPKKVRFLDASYGRGFEPKLSPRQFWEDCHIENACFFDIDDVANPTALKAHTMPDANIFEEKVSALGISNDETIIIYDQTGIALSAARAWWMFRFFGHEKLYVLNGGLVNIVNSNATASLLDKFTLNSVDTASAAPIPKTKYKTALNPRYRTAFKQDVERALSSNEAVVIEARPGHAIAQEGQIGQNVVNIPFTLFLDSNGTGLKNKVQLQKIFKDAGVTNNTPVITTCGSGVLACVPLLALSELNHNGPLSLYDGSYSDWSRPDPKI